MMTITVAGMIGTGKTTATIALAKHFKSEPFFELMGDNTILDKFYGSTEDEKKQTRYPFLLQLHFLNKRFDLIKKALRESNNVLDRSIYEDEYFAYINHKLGRINDLEFHIYKELSKNMLEEIKYLPKKVPDLIVYLRAKKFETVIRNIKRRDRGFEANDEHIGYYKLLWEGYDAWTYENLSHMPIVTIDVDDFNFADNIECEEELCRIVEQALNEQRIVNYNE